jgi:hypothetical protein
MAVTFLRVVVFIVTDEGSWLNGILGPGLNSSGFFHRCPDIPKSPGDFGTRMEDS